MYSRRVTGELSKTRCSCEVLICNEDAGKIEPHSSVFQLAELHKYIRDSFNLTEAICILFEDNFYLLGRHTCFENQVGFKVIYRTYFAASDSK